MSSFFVQNFGCRASQADGASLEASLTGQGLSPASIPSEASLVVLNTCTVTSSADQDVRQIIRRLQRDNPTARILVTGCYAQRSPEDLSQIEGVSWVVGNSHKGLIGDIVSANPTPYHAEVHVGDIFAQSEFFNAPVEGPAGDRSRPNLKIQDGCNNRCSFCIIPSVRGKSRSAAPDWVIAETQRLATAGYPEIVLTGINLGRWGREWGSGRQLPDLLRRLLEETSIPLIRLSSIEPMDFTTTLLELMAASPRIARHVHAPLQSGSDSVLRRMHRKYRPRHYAERIRLARELMPEAALGADVMVGFPGETDAEFAASLDFIESLPLTYLHVFTYSERPGTKAVDLPHPVPIEVRRQRNRILQQLSDRKNKLFRQSQIGRRLPAVTISDLGIALSTNYIRVELSQPTPARQLIEVELGPLSSRGMREASPLLVLD
ncbi:MAG: tRNA (N(6)-L-threonylcarbamoyladenosine(37)-C(2))-methylthiotransferase MtaB [Bryobacter sp.]|nr:tRNA (N(6)-L-threonylcarbamoyladenosine(37)-C(2))-methylthiotransferase MtaB [Bryobacter sp. CoA8 C33]